MKLSRTKIARLLKSKNQSRKSKSLGHKGFSKDELMTSISVADPSAAGPSAAGPSTNASAADPSVADPAKSKSLHYMKKRQRTAHLNKKPVNLRLKTMKSWHKPKADHKPKAGYKPKADYKHKPKAGHTQSGGAKVSVLNSLGIGE